jgi:hypothetical protein
MCVLGLLWPKQTLLPLNSFDQPFYLGIAQDIVQTGRFTNGFAFDEVPTGTERQSGMRFGPLYPATLAAVSWVDPGLRDGMACLAATNGHNPSCPDSAPVMRGMQFAELAGFFLLVWWIGRAAGGSLGMAWLTLGLALVTTPLLLRSVDTLMTEISSLFFITAAIAASIAAVRAPTWRGAGGWGLAAGLLLGLTALTRPGFLYLLPFALLAAAYLCLRRRTARWIVAGLAVGGVVTIGPWIARNTIMFGRPALTFGYDSHTLVQRIAFDTMSWHEYALSYLCWLPDGTSLGRNMIGPGACDRFGWDNDPNSFYSLGLRHMLDQTLAAAGGYEHHMRYLLFHFIFRMPVWHALVSVPLALRGAYVAHWWGFGLLVPCLLWTWIALRRGHAAFLIVALPAWFMLALNAAVAVNQVRYNLMLIPAYALAGAFSLRWLAHAVHRRAAAVTSRSRIMPDGARGAATSPCSQTPAGRGSPASACENREFSPVADHQAHRTPRQPPPGHSFRRSVFPICRTASSPPHAQRLP